MHFPHCLFLLNLSTNPLHLLHMAHRFYQVKYVYNTLYFFILLKTPGYIPLYNRLATKDTMDSATLELAVLECKVSKC